MNGRVLEFGGNKIEAFFEAGHHDRLAHRARGHLYAANPGRIEYRKLSLLRRMLLAL